MSQVLLAHGDGDDIRVNGVTPLGGFIRWLRREG